jgi:hypothetical protein
MCCDYGFRSNSGRLYQEGYGKIPDSMWHLVSHSDSGSSSSMSHVSGNIASNSWVAPTTLAATTAAAANAASSSSSSSAAAAAAGVVDGFGHLWVQAMLLRTVLLLMNVILLSLAAF